jgi:hypothetical protein
MQHLVGPADFNVTEDMGVTMNELLANTAYYILKFELAVFRGNLGMQYHLH